MSNPKVTIGIPTYNRSKFLRRCLKNVLLQTYKDFVIAVSDNNSDDDTEQVVKEFQKTDNRISYYKQKENIGLLGNIVHGQKNFKTPYYLHMGDDDLLFPDALENLVNAIEKHPNAYFVSGQIEGVDLDGTISRTYLSNWSRYGFFEGIEGHLNTIRLQGPGVLAALFKRAFFDQFGYPHLTLGAHSEHYLFYLGTCQFPFVTLNRPVAIWSGHEGSQSSIGWSPEIFTGGQVLLQDLQELYKGLRNYRDYMEKALPVAKKCVVNHVYYFAKGRLYNGDYKAVYIGYEVLIKDFNDCKKAILLKLLMCLFKYIPYFSKVYFALRKKRQKSVKTKKINFAAKYPQYRDLIDFD